MRQDRKMDGAGNGRDEAICSQAAGGAKLASRILEELGGVQGSHKRIINGPRVKRLDFALRFICLLLFPSVSTPSELGRSVALITSPLRLLLVSPRCCK